MLESNRYKKLEKPHVDQHYTDPDYEDVDVAIVMESTYPFLKGGVSAVVHDIITCNPDLSFGIIHISWDSSSPAKDLYGVPDNVRWIKTIYLSLEEHREKFSAPLRDLKLNSQQRTSESNKIIDAIFALINEADPNPLWKIYDRMVTQKTREFSGWSLLGSKEFMQVLFNRLSLEKMSFSEVFWLVRTFFSLTYALLHERMPYASVYHAHTTGYAALIGAAAARDNGTSFLLTEHNLYVRDTVNTLLNRNMSYPVAVGDYDIFDVTDEQRAWMIWWIQMGRFCYPSADLITYLYPKAIEEAQGLHGIQEKSVILPNGMLISDVNEAYAQRRLIRQEIIRKKQKHRWRFVFIARVVPIKGLLDLIKTLALLKDQGYNLHIDCLGPTQHMPRYYEKCREAVAQEGLEDYVTFHGTVNVRENLGKFDALVMPSYNEGQPIVALEAMSAAIPVIGTDVGGMSQLIDETLITDDGVAVGRCGILTQAGDPEGFAEALKQVMENPDFYEELCRNARERVIRFFQLHDVMEKYNRIYRKLGKLGPKPAGYLAGTQLSEASRTPADDSLLTSRRQSKQPIKPQHTLVHRSLTRPIRQQTESRVTEDA